MHVDLSPGDGRELVKTIGILTKVAVVNIQRIPDLSKIALPLAIVGFGKLSNRIKDEK